MSLEDLHTKYLAERGHKTNQSTIKGQAKYVLGEARELRRAARRLNPAGYACDWANLRYEIADVVLSAVTLAKMAGTTVEECIAEKTEKDRGRG